MSEIISDADLEVLTGYKIPSKQCQALRDAGVFFLVRKDGRPRTTWQHFNDPIVHRKKEEQYTYEPNFGALK